MENGRGALTLCSGARCGFRELCTLSTERLKRELTPEAVKGYVINVAEYSDWDGSCRHGVMSKVREAMEATHEQGAQGNVRAREHGPSGPAQAAPEEP